MGAPDVLQALSAAGVHLALGANGALFATPASALTASLRDAIRAHKAELVESLGPSPHSLTVARLEALGLTADQADSLALRIAGREADDPRRACVECAHCRPGLTCSTPKAAGVPRQLGPDLASIAQHCPGFAPRN